MPDSHWANGHNDRNVHPCFQFCSLQSPRTTLVNAVFILRPFFFDSQRKDRPWVSDKF